MKVAIRVDSSQVIGSGHVMRCRTLARELRLRGATVKFICRKQHKDLTDLLKNDMFSVTMLPEHSSINRTQPDGDYLAWLGVSQECDADETLKVVESFYPDWMIIDHYGLAESWESLLRPSVGKIMVIDDLANRQHNCDILLDQNWFGSAKEGRYHKLVSKTCTQLLGPKYALVEPEYRAIRSLSNLHSGIVRRIIVYFGASDDHNISAVLAQAFMRRDLAEIELDFVLGVNHPYAQDIRSILEHRQSTTLHIALPSLAHLMGRADLMIGLSSATTWERATLGLPALVGAISENQKILLQPLASEGLVFYIPPDQIQSVDFWTEQIIALCKNSTALIASSNAVRQLTDGRGTVRAADAIYNSYNNLKQ